MDTIILQRIKIAIIVFVFSVAFWGVAGEARAAVNIQPAQGPLTATATGYPYPDLQFYSPIPPFDADAADADIDYSPTYNYGCKQSSAGVLTCHKMHPSENVNDKYDCGNTTTSPANLADLGSAWLFNNCVFSGDILPPSSVTVTATPVSANQITVSWTTSVDDIGVAFYRVFRFQGACCAPTAIPPNIDVLAPQTTYSHTGLLAGTSYGYYVLAYDAAGNYSGSAGTKYAVTFSDGISPSIPTALSAVASASDQINLTWTASTDTGGSGLAGYHIERCTGATCADFLQIANALASATNFPDTTLAPLTTYRYRIRAYDNAGNNSGYSTIASDMTPAPLDTTPPTPAPVLSGSAVSSTQIDLSWTTTSADPETGIASYRIYRGISSVPLIIFNLPPVVSSHIDSGLSPSTTYTYRVDVVNGGGLTASSNTISVLTPAIPDTTPPVFTFTSPGSTLLVGTTSATLGGTTTNESGAPEIATCRYSTTSELLFTSMTLFSSDLLGPVVSHTQPITGLTNGAQYDYYVKCRDAVGNTNLMDFSYTFQVDSPAADTTAPNILSRTITGGGVTVNTPGVLPSGTQTATMSVVTDDDAYCRYNQDTNIAFGSMVNNFNSSDFKTHTASLAGPLTYGVSYLYYVKCQNTPEGLESTGTHSISFIISFPVNMNPVALITITPSTSGTAPFAISANGSGSYDSDGTITQYIWDWGQGQNSTGVGASHTYAAAGTYNLSLKVIDNQGGSDTTSQAIAVSAVAPPPPPPVNFCTAECTHTSECIALYGSSSICGPSRFCITQGGGVGPGRSDFYLSRTDGSMSQQSPATFPAGTASVIMSMKTDVNAECQYSTDANTLYGASAMKTFTSTGMRDHSVTLTGLQSLVLTPHTYYVRCRDLASGIVNNTDQAISFIIGAPMIVDPPGKRSYTCLINADYVSNNIPYVFDICIPKL